jgi:hypothetical protein
MRSRTVKRQGRRAVHVQVVDRAARLAPDFEHVAEAFGRNECNPGQIEVDLAEQRVGRDRAGVAQPDDLRGIDIAQQGAQGLEQADLRGGRRGSHLVAQDGAAGVGRDEIGERPADVHAHPPRHRAAISPVVRWLVPVKLAGDLLALPLIGERHVPRFLGSLRMTSVEPAEDGRDQCVDNVV